MTKKMFGLGKGIGSLIPDSVAQAVNEERKENIFYVEVGKITPNPDQPRNDFNEEALQDLARSIKKYGVLQPLLVSKVETDLPRGRSVQYQLIAGERRWRAAQLAGLPQVPVIIRDDLTPEKSDNKSKRLEVALVENIQREDLSALEGAEAYARLAEEFGLSHQEIADKVGKSRETVSNTIRLLGLPEYIKDGLRNGLIGFTHARALLGIKEDPDRQREIYELAVSGGATTHIMESIGAEVRKDKGYKKSGRYRDTRFDDLMGSLADHVGHPVKIVGPKASGQAGTITIRFTNLDTLNSIARKILG